MQLDLAMLPSETLRILQMHIAEEFKDMEKLLIAENVELK